jgi:serine protease
VSAAATSGYSFVSWSGDAFGSANPVSITMNANKNVVANFKAGASCSYGATPLTSGAGVPATVAQGTWAYYCITVPPGATNLSVQISGTGDVDLYTRYAGLPDSANYNCRPFINGSNETCTQANPSAGTWYIGLYGYTGGSVTLTATVAGGSGGPTCFVLTTSANPAAGGTVAANPASSGGCPSSQYTSGTAVQLTATARSGYSFANWSGDANGSTNPVSVTMNANRNVVANFRAAGASCSYGATPLTSGAGVPATVAQGSWAYYCIAVPSGATNLNVQMTGTGDVDLYTRFAAPPDSANYSCRPYINGSNETCTQASPSAGTWYIGLYGYTGGSVTLTATVS